MNANKEKSRGKNNKKDRFFSKNGVHDPVAQSAKALLGLSDTDSEDEK